MGFSRQDYWSGLPFSSPGNLPNPGIKPVSPALQVDSLPLSHQGSPMCDVLGFKKIPLRPMKGADCDKHGWKSPVKRQLQ